MIGKNAIISVFKTSISEKDLMMLNPIFNNFKKILNWSTDLEDRENILRIESHYSLENEIIKTLNSLNIMCVELH